MKILIWGSCLFANALLVALLRQLGVVLGGLPTMLLFAAAFYLARELCKNYDKKTKKVREENTTSWYCAKCGAMNDGAEKCVNCGISIEASMGMDWKCPSCGASNTKFAVLCPTCGFEKKKIKYKNIPVAEDFDNIPHIYFCKKCNSTYSGYKNDNLSKRCPNCKEELTETTILAKTWREYSKEEKEKAKSEIFAGIHSRNNGKRKSNIAFIRKEHKSDISVPDEIRKYKELLDIDAITEEEFEKKKRELLNL